MEYAPDIEIVSQYTEPEQYATVQVDTLDLSEFLECRKFGCYRSEDNIIEIKNIQGKSSFEVLSHELKHMINHNKGIYAYPMSGEQSYKLNMHDEISANIANLLELREKYIKTGDISVFDIKINPGVFDFYKNAVKSGVINPKSPYKEDFDKEMKFIAQGTRNMWMKNFSALYIKQNISQPASTVDFDFYDKFYNSNYNKATDIVYDINGVNFKKYYNDDISIPYDKIKNSDNKDYMFHLYPKVSEYDGSMSIQQYQKLITHLIYANKYLGSADDINDYSNNPQQNQALIKSRLKNIEKEYGSLIENMTEYSINNYTQVNKYRPTENENVYLNAVKKIYRDKQFMYGSNKDLYNCASLPEKDITVNISDKNLQAYNNLQKLPEGTQKINSFDYSLMPVDTYQQENDILDNNFGYSRKPIVRKWENKDGCRVSKAFKIKINENNLKRPTMSRNQAQQKAQTAQVMKADSQKANAATASLHNTNENSNTNQGSVQNHNVNKRKIDFAMLRNKINSLSRF